MASREKPEADAPLKHVRVIETGAFIAGPYCGQLLADLGADVIKIEPPGDGDPMRKWGLNKNGQSFWWSVIGRNKRSITLDLRRAEGQDLARRLIHSADVLVENFRPGTLESWNLDPKQLRQAHPELIVARVSGFGQTGPYRNRAGFGSVAEAMGGLRFLTGYPDRPPTRIGLSMGDSLAGIFAALGVVTSLFARESKAFPGKGQDVDVGITDGVLAVLEAVIPEYSGTGNIRQRTGSTLPGLAPSNLYPTKDGSWVIIAANADTLFGRLALVMGEPTLAFDPRYSTHEARARHQVELDERIARWTTTRSRDELLAELTRQGVPAGPIYDAEDIVKDPHYRERGLVVDIETENTGKLSMQGVVPKLSETPGSIRWPGPNLGEHNEVVFRDVLGLSSAEFSRLRAEGVI